LKEKHKYFKEKSIYFFGDSNVPIQGVSQAQVLLKTLVYNELPERYEQMFSTIKIPSDIERSMQQSVIVSHLLDAEQLKTAKIVNPLRPMRPFPRNYGITEQRKK
jgi:large subunit ribosomal protein L37